MRGFATPLIDALLARFDIAPKLISEVPDSHSSQVYLIEMDEEKFVLKVPYSQVKLNREREFLERLSGLVPVPTILGFFPGEDNLPGALILSYIPGRPATSEDFAISEQMGDTLARLHSVEMDRFTLVEEETDWWPAMENVFQRWVEECKGHIESRVMAKVIALWRRHYDELPAPDGPVVVHMDYRPGNLLVNENGVIGLIDFESSRGGSADVDFAKMKMEMWDVHPESKAKFLAGYRAIRTVPNLTVTMPFYELHTSFGAMAWCIRRGQESSSFYRDNHQALKAAVDKEL